MDPYQAGLNRLEGRATFPFPRSQARLGGPLRSAESAENLGKERKAPVIAAKVTPA